MLKEPTNVHIPTSPTHISLKDKFLIDAFLNGYFFDVSSFGSKMILLNQNDWFKWKIVADIFDFFFSLYQMNERETTQFILNGLKTTLRRLNLWQ